VFARPDQMNSRSISCLSAAALVYATLMAMPAHAAGPTFIAPPPPPVMPPFQKDGKWRGLLGASFTLTSGNSETMATLLNVDMARLTTHSKFAVQGFVNHGTSKVDGERQTTANKWGLSTQYDSDLTNGWFAFAKLGFDADRMMDLTLRSTASTGFGYHLIDTQTNILNAFAGLSYTDRRYRTEQDFNGHVGRHFSNPGALLGEESTHRLNDRVTLQQRLELYPDGSSERAHVAHFNGNLNVSMSEMLSLSVGLISTYNHNVPPGLKHVDTSLFTGLNIRLN
jgi:putative salt-induced outer membrane protein